MDSRRLGHAIESEIGPLAFPPPLPPPLPVLSGNPKRSTGLSSAGVFAAQAAAREKLSAAAKDLLDTTRTTASMNPFHPDLIAKGMDLTAKAVKAGVLTFADFMDRMIRVHGREKIEAMRDTLARAWDTYAAKNPDLGLDRAREIQRAEPLEEEAPRGPETPPSLPTTAPVAPPVSATCPKFEQRLERLPDRLRWALVFPVAVLAYGLVSIAIPLVFALVEVLDPREPRRSLFWLALGDYLPQLLASIAAPYCFVWCGSCTAPSHRAGVATALGGFIVVSHVFLAWLFLIAENTQYPLWWCLFTILISLPSVSATD